MSGLCATGMTGIFFLWCNILSVKDSVLYYFFVSEYKLDDRYIARYLGELTAKEEVRLMQLRKRFQATHNEKVKM